MAEEDADNHTDKAASNVMNVMEVIDFFKQRRQISDDHESLQKLREEKIDSTTLLEMSDTDLHSSLKLSYGDIHAAKRHFKKEKSNERTESIFTKLRQRMGRKTKTRNHDKSSDSDGNMEEDRKKNLKKKIKKSVNEENTRSEKLMGNENAKKNDRKIEIGWFDYNSKMNEYRQVRSGGGGGARFVNAPKAWKQEDILDHGKRVFFPNGKSKRGKISEFLFEVRNFMGDKMEVNDNVGDLYASTGARLLRFYIYTKKKETAPNPDTNRNDSELEQTSDDSLYDPKMDRNKDVQTAASTQVYNLLDKKLNVDGPSSSQSGQLVVGDNDTFVITALEESNMLVNFNPCLQIVPQNESLSCFNETIPLSFPIDDNNNQSTTDFTDILVGVETQQADPQESTIYNTPHQSTSMINILGNVDLGEERKEVIKIHKCNIFVELIELFKDKDLDLAKREVVRIMDNGQEEAGQGIGMVKDIITEFWDTFYMRCCEGSLTKVPILRHDMQKVHWQSVARIICNGVQFGMFPIKISSATFEDAIFGKAEGNLTEEFLQLIPPTDRATIKAALHGFEAELDDLIGVLECYDCRKYPSADNIKQLIEEIAHKEILQEPKFIIECWKGVFNKKLTIDKNDLHNLYDGKKPTVSKVINVLQFPDNLELREQIVAGYLKKFVKGLDEKGLENFIRFCTGSSLMCTKITVSFTQLSGFERRPEASTCGNVLKVPSSYESVADLREDFINIWRSNMWDMDYV